MNPRLASLQAYPFQRLTQLLQDVTPARDKDPIRLSVGEPQHPAPTIALQAMQDNLSGLAQYPSTRGPDALRQVMAAWATHRFGLDRIALTAERHVLPVSGTREALFSLAQAVIDPRGNTPPVVIMPNPFYQIYEGAALLAGAEPYFLNTTADNGYQMDFSQVPQDIWRRTQLVYICTPGNPAGAVMGAEALTELLQLAEHHDFIIASDECYSEIYFDEDEPPLGLLQLANRLGIEDYQRCLVFHSLSKRSNLPGLRSGFIAGDGGLLQSYLQYRTFHGCSLSLPVQAASIAAWSDETHVRANRELYRAKFERVLPILQPVLPLRRPEAGFYLWPQLPVDDELFTRELMAQENVRVLPGSYLSRQTGEDQSSNPGYRHVRLALVAGVEECEQAAHRIRRLLESL